MGFVSGLLGIGHKGANWTAQQANVLNPFTTPQTQQATQGAQSAIGSQQALMQALANQGGIQNQSNILGQQQGLANMLGAQALGAGPNPAMAQLAQTTGQNIAAQNALMAGQRGAGANVGLMAREAAQQGAGIQQQAVGQAATMRAQQQLAAEQALQNQQAQMAGLTSQQVGQQMAATGGLGQLTQTQQQTLLQALQGYNAANIQNAAQANQANVGIQQGMEKGQMGLLGGVLSGVSGIPFMGLADGGMVDGPKTYLGQYFSNKAKGGMIHGETLAAKGKLVPGKAQVKGDSLKNDNVPAMLSPGEVVIPRSVMQSSDPVTNAARFVHSVMQKNKGKK